MHRTRRHLTAAAGAAALALAAVPAAGAQAAPAADTADVETYVSAWGYAIPGGKIPVSLGIAVHTGRVARNAVEVTLPAGVAYESAKGGVKCEPPAAGGRAVTCVLDKDRRSTSWAGQMVVRVRKDVAPGTVLEFTSAPVVGAGTVDPRPGNDSKTARVAVREPTDTGVAWEKHSFSVAPGDSVTTRFTVTNHGPGPTTQVTLDFDIQDFTLYPPQRVLPKGVECFSDPGALLCAGPDELAPGESSTHVQTWKFGEEHAGQTFKVTARLRSLGLIDPDHANDTAVLTFHVAGTAPSAPAPPSASAAPSSAAPGGATRGPGGGGHMAETGTGPLVAAAAAGGALAVLLGALLLLTRTRARRSG